MASFRPDPISLLTGQLDQTPGPRAITAAEGGGKFSPDGAVLPFPGNTFLCHLDPTQGAHRALCEMQRAVRQSPVGALFTYLPPESFHMTVFQGVSPDAQVWPEGMARDASPVDVAEVFRTRLTGHPFPETQHVAAQGFFAGHSLTLQGATPGDELQLRQTRAALREATGLHHPRFETYTFHITLAYPLRWMRRSEAEEVVALSDAVFEAHRPALAQIDLGPVELCTFQDMHHFETIATLPL